MSEANSREAVEHKLSCGSRRNRPCNCPASDEVETYTLEVDEAVAMQVMAAAGFLGVFAVAAVILRALGLVTWSWWWVTAPFWGPLALVPVVLAVVFVVYFIQGIVDGLRAAGETTIHEESVLTDVLAVLEGI